MTESAYRALKRKGLRVTKIGKREFVAGSDWLDFVAQQPQQPA